MHLKDTLNSALKGVTVNTGRSLLTMLGIVIGVGSVVLMSGIGASMETVILSQISSLGADSMVIFPGREEGGASQITTGFDSLTMEDLRRLEQLPTVTDIAPVIFVPGQVTYERERGAPQILGTTPEFFTNQRIDVAEGRLLDEADERAARAVALIAPDVRENLFGSRNPLGKRIAIGERSYTVIGVTKPLGSQFFQNADDRVYVPFSLARQVTGQKYLSYMTLRATGSFDLAFADIKALLRRRHGIVNPEDDSAKDDFVVHSSEEASEILGSVSLGLTLFITTVAGISLIVGGIGIMNVMIVTVTERTREIGLRKAVGAKARDILLQFLIEAVLLTVIGGVIGLALGIGLSYVASLIVNMFLATYAFRISLPSVIAAMLMAGVTGLVFGISPARRAAALSPMEALRYE